MFKYHIQTVQVGAGGSSTISFSNIPQIYDDLVLVTSLRDNVGSGGWENAFIYPNNSSANMASRFMYGWGTNNTGSGVNNPAVIYHQTARGNNTANTFSNSSVTISNYSKSTFKSITAETSVERNDVAGINAFTSALWSDSSAINNLTIAAASGVFVQYSSASLYGVKRGSDGKTQVASGGTITTSGGYTIHTFNASGTFVANSNLTVEALVIGGGGGGGDDVGGGGGAGGYRTATGLTLAASTSYPIIVGSGGSRGTYAAATPGGSSSFAGITSAGGGKSAGYANSGGPGGSGGGGGSGGAAGAGNTPATSPSQGNNGANGEAINGSGGGGGGAGAAASGRNGGAGLASSITGTSVTRAGGGASGGTTSGGGQGTGGAGGGGNGGAPGQAGTANTGGGGGGGNVNAQAGNGGSGVVILRYPTPA